MLRLLQINTHITENINVYVAGGIQTCSSHITKSANNVKTSVIRYSVFARYVVWQSPLSVINTNGYRDLTYSLQQVPVSPLNRITEPCFNSDPFPSEALLAAPQTARNTFHRYAFIHKTRHTRFFNCRTKNSFNRFNFNTEFQKPTENSSLCAYIYTLRRTITCN